MKNRELIAANIEEAKEELVCVLDGLGSESEYDEIEFKIALEHAYHHLNYAWNIRNVHEQKLAKCSEKDYLKWSKYPVDEILEYE